MTAGGPPKKQKKKAVVPARARMPQPVSVSGIQGQRVARDIKAMGRKTSATKSAMAVAMQIALPEIVHKTSVPIVRGPQDDDHPGVPTAVTSLKTEHILKFDASNESVVISRPCVRTPVQLTQTTTDIVKYERRFYPGDGGSLLGGSGYDDRGDVSDLDQRANTYPYYELTTPSSGTSFVGPSNFRQAWADPRDFAPMHEQSGALKARGPVARAGDQAYIAADTADVTAVNFNPYSRWLLSSGTISEVTAAAVAATTGRVTSAAMTAPAGTVALIDIGFLPNTTASATLTAVTASLHRVAQTDASMTVGHPLGSADGADLDAILSNASLVRVLGHSLRVDPQANRDFNGSAAIAEATDLFGPGGNVNLDYESIAAAPSSHTGDANQGVYAWTRPTKWLKPHRDEIRDATVAFIKSIEVDPSVRALLYTTIEYVPTTQLPEAVLAPCPQIIWKAAMDILNDLPRLYSNDVHVDDIVKFIGNLSNELTIDLAAAAKIVPGGAVPLGLASLGVHALGALGTGIANLFR